MGGVPDNKYFVVRPPSRLQLRGIVIGQALTFMAQWRIDELIKLALPRFQPLPQNSATGFSCKRQHSATAYGIGSFYAQ